jgi:hypothetical protein
MNPEEVLDMVGELSILKYFPSDPAARIAVARLAATMANDRNQIRWLITRMTSGLYSEWPGPGEMRACFCSRYKPKDGIDIGSSVYVDGIPSERPQLAAPPRKALPPEHVASVAASVDATVRDLAELKDMNRIAPARRVREIHVVQVTKTNALTQEDIDRAVCELREAKARREAGLPDPA